MAVVAAEKNARAFYVIQLGVVLGSLCTAAVGLRLVARWKGKARFGSDDGFIVASLLLYYTMVGCSVLLVQKGGLGKSQATFDASEISCFLQLIMASMIAYSITITTVKLSLLLLLRRIFDVPTFRTWSAIVVSLCVILLCSAIFANLLQCSPFNAAFKQELLDTENCLPIQSWYWGITITNLVFDVVILILPMWRVIDLRLPFAKKCLLCGIFGFGGMGCVAGVMRVVAIGGLQHDDLTHTMVMQHVWSQVEPATAIVCVCVSTYRPLFEDWKNRTAEVSSPFSNSIPSQASPRCQLQQGSESLKYGMSNQVMRPNVDRHPTGHRGFSGREGMFV